MSESLKLDKRNSAYERVGAAATAVLTGADDINDWDDDELAFGRRRGKNGKFGGQPPRMIPMVCLRELTRRKIFDTESVIREAIVDAARYIAGVAQGKEQPNADRQRAAQVLLDRFLGKPTERVDVQMSVTAQVESLPWVQALRTSARPAGTVIEAIATRLDDGIIDAELVEADLCACGCGQPPRKGSLYLNARHQEYAVSKRVTIQPSAPTPIDDDPILSDDEFIEDEDDPVLW
jgi:hypothetical protein